MNKLYKIIINILRSFSTAIFSFIISLIGITSFGKENWGNFIHLLTWILFFAFITNFGNKEYLLRKYSTEPSKRRFYFTTSLLSRSILLILSVVLFFIFSLEEAISSITLIILLFIYQSFDSIIVYDQKFLQQLIAEILGFITITVGIFFFSDYNLIHIIQVYCVAYLLKIMILFNLISPFFKFGNSEVSLLYLKNYFPFFLIIFSGWISSKMDFYVVNFMLPAEQISEYQIGITSFYILQSVSYLIILPFTKHLYRLNLKTIKKIKNKISLISFPIVLIGSVSIWLILEKIVILNLSSYFYVIGAIASIPTFFFIVDIMMHYRFKKEKTIMRINFFLAFINLIISIILIKNFGINGALISMLIIQYIALLFYKKIIKI